MGPEPGIGSQDAVVGANQRLKAPLIYSTEVARSIALKGVDQLRQYDNPQPFGIAKEAAKQAVSGKVTKSKWRVILDRDSADARDAPPAASVKAMSRLIYGLVNVRTDGKRLLFAVRNEGNQSWAIETIEEAEVGTAYRMEKPANA